MSKEKTSKSSGSGRTRNYATIVYPDSAPENWRDILVDCMVPAFISPLHDKDLNPNFDDDKVEFKKAHYHVMIMFDGVKTVDQAKEIFNKIGGVGCVVIASIRGHARYLCHLDNPEKAQYSPDDVTCLCGADYTSICTHLNDKYRVIEEMLDWCVENECYSYVKLMLYSKTERRDWFRSLCDNSTIVMKEFLKSLKWDIDQLKKRERMERSVNFFEESQKALADIGDVNG